MCIKEHCHSRLNKIKWKTTCWCGTRNCAHLREQENSRIHRGKIVFQPSIRHVAVFSNKLSKRRKCCACCLFAMLNMLWEGKRSRWEIRGEVDLCKDDTMEIVWHLTLVTIKEKFFNDIVFWRVFRLNTFESTLGKISFSFLKLSPWYSVKTILAAQPMWTKNLQKKIKILCAIYLIAQSKISIANVYFSMRLRQCFKRRSYNKRV